MASMSMDRLQPEPTETSRIEQVYGQYCSSSYRSRWTGQNSGNQAILDERNITEIELLAGHRRLPTSETKMLDFGCGSGAGLEWLCRLGGKRANAYGVDIRAEAVAAAQARYDEMNFLCAGGAALPFSDCFFDLIQAHVVLSSILEEGMRVRVCGELDRILRPGGAILLYDIRVNNPYNSNVRALRRREIRNLFPDYQFDFRSLTVIPQLARKLGCWCPRLYPWLRRFRVLHTHNLSLGIKLLKSDAERFGKKS